MNVRAVELHDFRNLARVLLEPHARMNVLAGDNGQGKTNFLEALYLLGTLRAFRAQRVDELVRFGQPRALCRARLDRGELTRLYEVEIAGPPWLKRARVDGKGVRASAEHFGGFNVVLFEPEDLRVVRGAPAGRRRLVDRAVYNAVPAYLKEAQLYERILKSRNVVLKQGETAARTSELLVVYDEQLAEAGARIVRRRRDYLATLAPRACEAFARITRIPLRLALRYEPDVGRAAPEPAAALLPDEALAPALLAALQRDRRKDLDRGFTARGPHGDDLAIDLDGHPARAHASQGQTRAIVLAWKVAEIEHLAELLGEPPILLLDDVSSELDAQRTAYLFEFIAGLACQAFLSTTALEELPLPLDRKQFRVVDGTLAD